MAALHGNMHIGEVNQLKMYQEAPLQTHSVRNSDGGTSDGTHYLNHANPVPGADKCMGMLTHRRKRINYTQKQVEVLENAFSAVKYPDVFIREGLEAVTGVPEPRIQVWFQNRRAKSRRQLNSSVSANAANAQAANSPLGQQRGIALQGAFENRPGAVVHQMRDSGLQDNFRPSVHQNTAATRRTSRPTRPRSHHEPSVSWRMNQGQMHQHMQSVNASKSNACLFPNEHHRNMENNTAASQGPTVLVEYDNFPPNRTIGPEMRVVIPPLPTQNSCHASTSKANGCQMQYPQVRASGARFIPFPPDQFSKGTRP